MRAKEILNQAMVFDPLAAEAEAEPSKFEEWLLANPDSWRCPRVPDRDVEGKGQSVNLYIGEEGAGKTTQMNTELEKVEDPAAIIVRLDFTSAAVLATVDSDKCEPALGRFLHSQVDQAVMKQGSFADFQKSLRRLIIETKAHYSLTLAKERYDGRLATTLDSTLSNDPVVHTAVRSYLATLSALDAGIHSLEAVQRISGRRAYFVVDNVDHLGERKIEKVFDAISGALSGNSVAFIAVRGEHEHLAVSFRHQRRVTTIRLGNDGKIFEILNIRMNGALKYINDAEPSQEAEALRVRSALDRTSALIQKDPKSIRLVQDWQNGNVRQMLTFLGSVAGELEHRADFPTYQGSVRGLLYNELIRKNASPHLLDIFNPQHVKTRGDSLPFVFLRLRLLAYLKRRVDGTYPVTTLHKDFEEHFGISATTVDAAIESLCTKTSNSGALVRRTSDFAVENFGLRGSVVLLPAGRCFIDETVYSCDYLSWIYDEAGSGEVNLVDVHRPTEIKLVKAVAAVEELLIPNFVLEHPYIGRTMKLTNARRQRLNSYLELFDYGKGRWFILRLKDELEEYASVRRIQNAQLDNLTKRLAAMVARLDKLLK